LRPSVARDDVPGLDFVQWHRRAKTTAVDGRFALSELRTVTLRGTSEPVEIVTVDWSQTRTSLDLPRPGA